MRVALLGAESTGKTQLALELASQLRARGKSVVVVPEVLRSWCEQAGRTPRPQEQMPIAHEQERLVDLAATQAQVVITDTTAIMVAIYSAMLFDDGSLYQFALARQRIYDITLVTGLDLPWVADGLQRDGPHVREPVDALVRSALAKAGVPYRVIYGTGAQRTMNALSAIDSSSPRPESRSVSKRWNWACDKCSDPGCEHRLFSTKLASG